MAPEACQSEPYTSKSDVWALGCILYELCTLKKPFEADNLLGLVFKIVTDEVPPLDPKLGYSQDVQNLINKLLQKDPKNRPSIAEILHMSYVEKKMQEFISNQGQKLKNQTKVFNKNMPKVEIKDKQPTETPKQAMERRKREQADAEFKLKSQAAG